MNIYRYELRALRKYILIWALSMTALSALYLGIYPSIVQDADSFRQLLANYPEGVRAALNVNLNYIASLVGFYSLVFSFVLLCGSIQAMHLGVSILSKESRERTADFLLVKPVSRMTIVSAKLLAAISAIVITDLIFYAGTLLLANAVTSEKYDQGVFLLINLSMLFVQLIFMAMGFLVSIFFKKVRNVLTITFAFVFGFYLVGAVFAGNKSDEALRFLSPFRYYDIGYISSNSAYEVPYILLSVAIITLCTAATYLIYRKKDIHAIN